jgi:anti-sigma factor RsiW
MTASDPRPVGEDDLHAFIDERLDPARREIVEAWLAAHPGTAERVRTDRLLRDRLRERLAPMVAEPIPARLRVASLADRRPHRPARAWMAIAASGLVGIGLGGAVGWFGRGSVPPATESATLPMTRDAVAAYRTFVVETAHPVEVRANEATHLVQWLSRRIDHPLHVPDLTSLGFRLMGGRVLPAGDHPAAMLMYDDASGMRLTLYARAGAGEGRTSFRYARERDVAAFSWVDGSLSYAVTASTSEARLLTVAQLVVEQVRNAAPP